MSHSTPAFRSRTVAELLANPSQVSDRAFRCRKRAYKNLVNDVIVRLRLGGPAQESKRDHE